MKQKYVAICVFLCVFWAVSCLNTPSGTAQLLDKSTVSTYEVKNTTIDEQTTKEITFPDITDTETLRKSDIVFDMTDYKGSYDVRLMAWQNVTETVLLNSYLCNCRSMDYYEFMGNRIYYDCETCYNYVNVTTEKLAEITDDIILTADQNAIYEVGFGCKRIENKGCSSWSDITILGEKIVGATSWNESYNLEKNIVLTNATEKKVNERIFINVSSICEVNSCSIGGDCGPGCRQLRITEDNVSIAWNCYNGTSNVSCDNANASYIQFLADTYDNLTYKTYKAHYNGSVETPYFYNTDLNITWEDNFEDRTNYTDFSLWQFVKDDNEGTINVTACSGVNENSNYCMELYGGGQNQTQIYLRRLGSGKVGTTGRFQCHLKALAYPVHRDAIMIGVETNAWADWGALGTRNQTANCNDTLNFSSTVRDPGTDYNCYSSNYTGDQWGRLTYLSNTSGTFTYVNDEILTFGSRANEITHFTEHLYISTGTSPPHTKDFWDNFFVDDCFFMNQGEANVYTNYPNIAIGNETGEIPSPPLNITNATFTYVFDMDNSIPTGECHNNYTLKRYWNKTSCVNDVCSVAYEEELKHCPYGCEPDINQYGADCIQPDYIVIGILVMILFVFPMLLLWGWRK